MFGYISPDIPNLFVKDGMLYKAMYCGLCKSIGSTCGQTARMGLSYDVTFFSALLHNIKNVNIKVEQQHCISHHIKKRPVAVPDELTDVLACVNTALTYYKLTDDILDENKGRMKRLWFASGMKKVQKAHPTVADIVRTRMAENNALEREGCDSPDRAADATAIMLKELSTYALGEYATEATEALCYAVGKWIYLIDAIDDYDKDVKKKRYNVFYRAYGAKTREELVKEHGEDLSFLFRTLFFTMREALSEVKFHFNHDLTDNIVMLGIPAVTKRVFHAEALEKPNKFRV